MIEVEVKARINGFESIKKALSEKGAQFIKSSDEIDIIFGIPKHLDSDHKVIEGGIIARIRQKDGKKILEFKEISREKGGVELKCEIGDIELIKKFLGKLDFEQAFTIKKLRETYSYNSFVICLDDVAQLGTFIEIEKIVNSPDEKDAARKACFELLNELLPNAEIENKKYGDLMQDIINHQSK